MLFDYEPTGLSFKNEVKTKLPIPDSHENQKIIVSGNQ